MQNLVEKDALHEVSGLIALIANKPECEMYKQALREAGNCCASRTLIDG
jgi:hypothetical protein